MHREWQKTSVSPSAARGQAQPKDLPVFLYFLILSFDPLSIVLQSLDASPNISLSVIDSIEAASGGASQLVGAGTKDDEVVAVVAFEIAGKGANIGGVGILSEACRREKEMIWPIGKQTASVDLLVKAPNRGTHVKDVCPVVDFADRCACKVLFIHSVGDEDGLETPAGHPTNLSFNSDDLQSGSERKEKIRTDWPTHEAAIRNLCRPTCPRREKGQPRAVLPPEVRSQRTTATHMSMTVAGSLVVRANVARS